MIAQTKPHTFNHFEKIPIMGFLKHFQLACDTNRVHGGSAMWLFQILMDETVSAVPNACLRADGTGKKNSQLPSGKTMYFSTY